MNRITRISLFFRVFFQIFLIAAPLLFIYTWINAPEHVVLANGFIQMDSIPKNYSKAILHTLSSSEKMLGFAVSSIPMLIELFIVYSLAKLFALFEKQEVFSLNNVRYIRNIGYALLLDQLISPFYQFAMGIVITMENPHGHRFASITLDQTNIGVLLTALMVILISWIVAEGYKLRVEQELII